MVRRLRRLSDKGLVGRCLLQSLKGSANWDATPRSHFDSHIFHFYFHVSHFDFDISHFDVPISYFDQCVTVPKMLNTNTDSFSEPNFFRY